LGSFGVHLKPARKGFFSDVKNKTLNVYLKKGSTWNIFLLVMISRQTGHSRTFQTSSRGPRSEITINAPLILKMRDIMLFNQNQKNNIPNFQKSAVHWYFYVPLRPEPSILSFYVFILFYFFYCFNKDMWRKPREISQFGKKSAKVYHSLYSSSEQLQVVL
jgi:hypothetical protein